MGPEPPSVRVQPVPLDQAAEPPPEIYEVEGSITETAVLRGYRNERLCCRFRSAADNLSGDEIILEVDELEQPVFFLTNLGKGRWQVNAVVPELPSGARKNSAERVQRSRRVSIRPGAIPLGQEIGDCRQRVQRVLRVLNELSGALLAD